MTSKRHIHLFFDIYSNHKQVYGFQIVNKLRVKD